MNDQAEAGSRMPMPIIERIKKLLMRTEQRGATAAEAEQAIALVDRLLKKHGLSIDDVTAATDRGEESVQLDTRRPTRWTLNLACMLAQHYGCEAFERDHWQGRVLLFRGPEHLASVCCWLFRVVANDLYNAGTRAARRSGCRHGKVITFRNEFCVAAIGQINARLNPRPPATAEEKADLVAKAGSHKLTKRERARLERVPLEAWIEGSHFGREVSLDTNAIGRKPTANIDVHEEPSRKSGTWMLADNSNSPG